MNNLLKLRTFFPYHEMEGLVEKMTSDQAGLIIVAGPDSRSIPSNNEKTRSSGRTSIFRVLMDELIAALAPGLVVVVSSDRDFLRIPRYMQKRILVLTVDTHLNYETQIKAAIRRHPALIVLDHLNQDTLQPALKTASQGFKILTQIETVFRGSTLVRYLMDLGANPENIGVLKWILAVQRMETLCPHCKQPDFPSSFQRLRFMDFLNRWGNPHLMSETNNTAAIPLFDPDKLVFFQSKGCSNCRNTGHLGDIAVVDLFHAQEPYPDLIFQSSMLSFETCGLNLAMKGQISLDEMLLYGEDPFYRTFHLLVNQEQSLSEANNSLERTKAELEASNRVLQQRNKALFSLEEFSQVLIGSSHLDDLADKVCRRARDLCGADKTVLYFLQTPSQIVILSALGWDLTLVQPYLDVNEVISPDRPILPTPFYRRPPGIQQTSGETKETPLRAGLHVPLVAQEQLVGLMIVHSTHKAQFNPGEVALLQTFANQAAVALQRAGLIEQLQLKINELEKAQAGLAQKERYERELELARQVQQSMLPRTYPEISGFSFAAKNEPARQVGGDFFDIFNIDGNLFGFVVADVSDKGMPSALYMALTRSLLRAEAQRETSPCKTLQSVNRLLIDLGEQDMFVTVFYGVIDRHSLQLTYARAGHDRPIWIKSRELVELDGVGLPLGIFGDDVFYLSEEKITIQPGNRLILYTDGLSDVQGENDQPIGREHLKQILQSNAELPAEEFCETIFSVLLEIQGMADQVDDMTMLVIDVTKEI